VTTDRHHALAFKSIRRSAHALLLAPLLLALLLPVVHAPGHAQGPEEVVLYEENFDDGQAQGWDLDEGWRIEAESGTNYVLSGSGHNWARYAEGEWQDFRVSFRLSLREQNSVIHLNYRLSDEGRYYISFRHTGSSLEKQYWPDRFLGPLATSDTPYDYWRWYQVEIVGEGAHIQFFVNGELQLDYTDPQPLLSGTIAFETLNGSYAQVDDIVVIGLRLPPEEPDLAVFSAKNWDFSDDGRILVLLVGVANQGGAEAPETLVRVTDPDHGWVGSASVPGLGPEERITVKVQLEIPEELRGATCTFIVEVDPDDQIRELDEENNVEDTPWILIPRLSAEGPHIDDVRPAEGRCGTELTLTIVGSNFAPGTTVFIPEGIETLYTEFINPGELEARIAIHQEASPGPRPVEVVNPDGQSDVSEAAFTVVCPERPPEPRPDLVLLRVSSEIVEEGRGLVIAAEVENAGNDTARGIVVRAAARGWAGSATIDELHTGDTAEVTVRLEIRDELRGRSHLFEVAVDPENEIFEWREDNNLQTIEVQLAGSPGVPPELLILIAVGIAAAGIALTYGRRARKPARKPEEEPRRRAPPPPEERIVNTGFSSQTRAGEPLDPFMPLAPGQPHYFWFEVGPPVPGSIEAKPEPLMVEFLPSEARLNVVLFAFEDEIEITAGGDVGEIQIMPDGKVRVVRQVERPESVRSSPDLLDRRLFFLVRTPNKEGVFRLRCNIYYEHILIQSRLIRARVAGKRVRSDVPVSQSTIEYTMSKALNPNYLVRMEPQTLSVMLNNNGDGTHCLRLFGEQDFKSDACFDAGDLETVVKHVRGALRRASWGDEEPWREDKSYRYERGYDLHQLKDDLVSFAIRGYRFWSKLTVQIAGPRPEVEKLKRMVLKPTTVEFAIKDKIEASHLFPPAMIYDYPLDTNLNREDYQLCPSFLRALEARQPLEETSCFKGDCPSRREMERRQELIESTDRRQRPLPLNMVCPSGFWGFRHSIGNPLGSRSEINHEMLYQQAPELTVAVFPSFHEWPKHQQALKSLMPGMTWNLADTREETRTKLKSTKPHLVYFYCHGGVISDTPFIKVGAREELGITPDNLDGWGIEWKYPQPLVFINGCHTTASEPKQALHFVEKFVITCNAAGVIGTEITIFEELAAAFAEECLRRFLVGGETIGDSVRRARLKLLGQGNPLGLVYNIYANAGLRLKKAGKPSN